MDTEAAQAVMTRHHPRRLLAILRIMRCIRCCKPWPCGLWLHARDQLRRDDDLVAIERITKLIGSPCDRDRS